MAQQLTLPFTRELDDLGQLVYTLEDTSAFPDGREGRQDVSAYATLERVMDDARAYQESSYGARRPSVVLRVPEQYKSRLEGALLSYKDDANRKVERLELQGRLSQRKGDIVPKVCTAIAGASLVAAAGFAYFGFPQLSQSLFILGFSSTAVVGASDYALRSERRGMGLPEQPTPPSQEEFDRAYMNRTSSRHTTIKAVKDHAAAPYSGGSHAELL